MGGLSLCNKVCLLKTMTWKSYFGCLLPYYNSIVKLEQIIIFYNYFQNIERSHNVSTIEIEELRNNLMSYFEFEDLLEKM